MITELVVAIPDHLEPPDLNICIRYIDIFDDKSFSRNTGKEIKIDFNNITSIQLETAEKVAISDLFDYTPDLDDLFNSCIARAPLPQFNCKVRKGLLFTF